LRFRNSLLLILVAYLFSCSEEKRFSGQEIFVDISPKVTVYFAETDLTSLYPFPHSTFLDSKAMLSYNMLRNSLDTIYFEGDTLKVKEGFYLEKDGPRRTEGINNLVYTALGLVLFNAKNVMIDKDGLSDIENFRLIESDLFRDNVFYSIASGGVSYYLDWFYKGYDQNRENLFFFARDFKSKDFKLIKFDLEGKSFKEMPMWANFELINNYEVEIQNVSKNHMPFIFIQGDILVLSYNYSNEFVIVDLNTESKRNKKFASELFPLRKRTFQKIDLDTELIDPEDFKRIMDLINEWDKDVAFGNFEKLPNGKGFCRLVRGSTLGENKTDPQLFLEVFNNEWDKIGEVSLSELEPNLSTLFFAIGDRLFFKAKEQDNENYMDYYFVEVDF
jgi:hypothetical protein